MKKSVPGPAIDIMLASLAENTVKQYDSCLKKWFVFCISNNFDVLEASIPNILTFLTQMFHEGVQYGTLNSCRSALSLILDTSIGNDDRIKRFFKGVFRLRPPLPKYSLTWNTSQVLDYLGNWHPNESLNLEKITKKLVTLLTLITAHRVQTISKIDIRNIEQFSDKIIIKIPDILKTSRIGSVQPVLVLPCYEERPQICPVKTLQCYLNVTESLRSGHFHLFLSFRQPHRNVTSQTISRWVKDTLRLCGIDVSIFTAHSTRHAATSKAQRLGVNLDVIRKTAGWSGSSRTFGRFYNRNVMENSDDTSFARTLMLLQND